MSYVVAFALILLFWIVYCGLCWWIERVLCCIVLFSFALACFVGVCRLSCCLCCFSLFYLFRFDPVCYMSYGACFFVLSFMQCFMLVCAMLVLLHVVLRASFHSILMYIVLCCAFYAVYFVWKGVSVHAAPFKFV